MQGDGGWRRGAAITFAVLMVTSMIVPVGALAAPGNGNGPPSEGPGNGPPHAGPGNGPPGEGPGNSPPDNGQGNGPPDDTPGNGPPAAGEDGTDASNGATNATELADAPPVLKHFEAVRITRNISDDGHNAAGRHRDRAHQRLNDSLAYYRGPVRVNDSNAFIEDAQGLRALAHLVRGPGEPTDARQAADLVYEADNETATTAIADARRVIDRHGEDVDNRGAVTAAESLLNNAERALARGQDLRDRDGRQYFLQRAHGVTQFRVAHEQAHQAIERIDRGLEPGVSIETAADPVWDGTGNRTYTVRGTVSAVRPSAIENVTISVNGEERTEASTSLWNAAPGEDAHFQGAVNLTERVNRIEVTAVVDEDGRSASGETATAVLRLDGDGLPGPYENETVGTDPLDPDSDSALTDEDESDDGTIDGREDFDGDGLATIDERELGTDPLAADTDEDGLDDGQELAVQMDPLKPDSDSEASDANESENGVEDGAEDLDGDGLTNAEEFEQGSSPLYVDGDADGLTDPEEIELGTDPLHSDTDGDFLSDGEELQDPFNTDPLDPDTDDDGIVDGNETYTTTRTNDTYGVTVALEGQGNVASGLTVENGTTPVLSSDAIENASVAPLVNLETERSFDSARVTFEYDESAVDENTTLAVARYNQTRGTFDLLNTTGDRSNGTVSAETAHFSRFTVFNVENWETSLTATTPSGGSGNATTQAVDVVYVMDSSGSMGSNDPNGFRKIAAKRFTGALIEGDRAAVVDFDSSATITQSLTTNFEAVNDSIDRLDANGGTNIGGGVAEASQHLAAESNDSRAQVQILLTDGVGSGGIAEAHTAAERGTTIHTIGFGGANTDKLEQIAAITNGTFSWVEDAEDLPEVFSRVAENTTQQDSDGDGLPDGVEAGFTTGQGHVVSTDPEDPDTDGDGLVDGTEAGRLVNETQVVRVPSGLTTVQLGYWNLTSDPTKADSDDDGLDDGTEIDGWEVPVVNASGGPDPYRFDTQCVRTGVQNGQIQWQDCEAPGENITVASSPLWAHTDEDDLTDFEEFNATYTDPEEAQTYGITETHEQLVRDSLHMRGLRTARLAQIGAVEEGTAPHDVDYNDATDDFDVVIPDDTGDARPLVFTALDGTERPDTWLTNEEELAWSANNPGRLDPWDPDTDDDGLTDGQEAEALLAPPSLSGIGAAGGTRYDEEDLGTAPTDPDTDGDGYWDGWIGVYDVGRTDNVVLYRENLETNVTGDEIVQKQVHVHAVDTDDPGADLYGNGTNFHSNTHVGELHWETAPTDSSDTPAPAVTIEVDYQADQTGPYQSATWRQSIEANYALYGINVTFLPATQTQVIDFTQPPFLYQGIGLVDGHTTPPPSLASRLVQQPFTDENITAIRDAYSDSGAGTNGDESLYFFVANVTNDSQADLLDPNLGGVRWNGGDPPGMDRDDSEWIAIFDHGLGPGSVPNRLGLNQTEEERARSLKTVVHEIGHVLNAGENEPAERQFGNEVYSGSSDDPTIEQIEYQSTPAQMWSVMSDGSVEAQYVKPSNETYFAFSIEELFTISTDDTQVSDGG